MRKVLAIVACVIFLSGPVVCQQTAQEFTQQELSVIETIKAQNRLPEETTTAASPLPPKDPMQAPPHAVNPQAADSDIQLSEHAKQQAWAEHQKETEQENIPPEPEIRPEEAAQEEKEADSSGKKCLTVAFIDIDIAFNEHPRTQAVKKQIDLKIKSKQREVQNAKDIIEVLQAENSILIRQLAEMKPFYEQIVTDQLLLPRVPESADTLAFNNMINRLLFAGCEILSTSPLNTSARLDDITERIGANKKIIAERSFFIDNYKYQTREEILKLEQEEVKLILQDIYTEIKSFAKKRNIGAVVRKDEILYGQKPVNITKDFVSVLKKSKKYRKK